MNHKNILFLFLFLFSIFNNSFAQKELPVGTKAPQIEYQTSYPKGYKIPHNKPIILDFWATWCGPCVSGLLKSNEWVTKYADKIDFIAITAETTPSVETFIKRYNLSHYFIIDSAKKTQNKFGVKSLPYMFLIDKKGIIQWQGTEITPELIDDFLTNGTITEKNNIHSTSASQEIVSDAEIQNKITLSINESPKNNTKSGNLSISFSPEVFIFETAQRNIKSIIGFLYNDNFQRIIHKNIPEGTLNKLISINFFAEDVDVEKTKDFLINSIGNSYGFTAHRQIIDTIVWKIDIVDYTKLNLHKTIVRAKAANYSGIYASYVNFSIEELSHQLENIYGFVFKGNSLLETGFDFEKINIKDITNLQKELYNKYGLSLEPKREAVEFLIVEGF